MSILQYDVVRVRKLLRSPDDYNGWLVNKRSPRVGNIGAVIDILRAPGSADNYVVESSDSYGSGIWLGEFMLEELELANPK